MVEPGRALLRTRVLPWRKEPTLSTQERASGICVFRILPAFSYITSLFQQLFFGGGGTVNTTFKKYLYHMDAMCGDQRTVFRSWFPPTIWVLGILCDQSWNWCLLPLKQ